MYKYLKWDLGFVWDCFSIGWFELFEMKLNILEQFSGDEK